MTQAAPQPLGVFDSGVGGLTVLQALRARLPDEHFVYLGDTARLPYGTKNPDTVVRYALQAAKLLAARDIKALVVACNTASAVALPALREQFSQLPVVGVVEPGADAAVAASRNARIVVTGTEATVRGGAYQRAIRERQPNAYVQALACQMFVALAEEGWTDGAEAAAVAHRYLAGTFAAANAPDTLLLGCTHFPMLRDVIRAVVGNAVTIVDSAQTTALVVQSMLETRALAATGARGSTRFLATDDVARFAAVGSRFLGRSIDVRDVELVDLIVGSATGD